MNLIATNQDEQALIEKALQRMRAHEPGIPGEKVRLFIAKLGEEIERTGELDKEFVAGLLQKLKNGSL